MAVVVSHAMRRFPSPPDASYACGLRSETANLSWSQESSSLSRSMRYADAWLYEGVRASPSGLLLAAAPAFVLCSCSDYLLGSKKLSKKGSLPGGTCKKCKGTRIPLPTPVGDPLKFGTMRCYQPPMTSPPAPRAGTVRSPSSRRPSILPATTDPYDLMRRSRLTVAAEKTPTGRPKFSTVGRKSILECNINPYDLMAESPSVTMVSGQRIRVRPPINDYEQLKTPRSQIPKLQKKARPSYRTPPPPPISPPPPPTSASDKESSKFKSILKKPGIYADVEICNFPERTPSPCRSTGTLFYPASPRKKVQFMEDDPLPVFTQPKPITEEEIVSPDRGEPDTVIVADEEDKRSPPMCRLRRSESERARKEVAINKAIFHDSMALRTQQSRHADARIVFSGGGGKEGKEGREDEKPKAPPRKQRGGRVKETARNRTVVRIGTEENVNDYKVTIRNESPTVEALNVNTIAIGDQQPPPPLAKTSILINGDECYSTIKLYHASVVVTPSPAKRNHNSSVYITGDITSPPSTTTICVGGDSKSEEVEEEEEAEVLQTCLSDPVEAVRLNLVPHVCGRVDPQEDRVAKFVHESIMKMRTCKVLDGDDKDSEHSSSTQYELMEQCSDCYTDHSNRSSITEEELTARTKFYEMLADSASVEVADAEDHHYESIKINPDPIYEEIEIPPPLPTNPPPLSLLDELQIDKEYTTRSIFEGASKYDILSYLVDAKERGIVPEDNSYVYHFETATVNGEEEDGKEDTVEELAYNRVSHLSTVSDSSEDSSLVISSSLLDDKRSAEVERNDSGVGSETSKSSLSKYRTKADVVNVICEDCDTSLDAHGDHEPLICRKCAKKRCERKEIIGEIVETEEKYSRDLQIILEEFYQPMLVAGLLTSEQLAAIFLNVEELLENSQALAERLRDAVEIAGEQGDEDLQTVDIGKLILEAAPMLHAFETYCVRQGAASLLLAGLEKEKELLRIFLRVSQMENTVLRRMNLNSFLMVPVQRVTKYPLLLARLHKVTPPHFGNREQLKEAQTKIELHLSHMNAETKDVPSKLWRRISSIPGRRSSSEMDLVNIKLRKIAVDVLEWNHDEAKFALEGKLLFTQPTDNNWRKGRTIKLTPINALLVTNGKSAIARSEASSESLVFSRQAGVRDAALLLVRDKNGRYTLLREPLYLDRCVIAADPAWQSYFEVQELLGKDTFIFKAEDEEQTKLWYRQLQYYAQGMGTWRKRRNALANIMINGMGLRA